ncbi:MAG: hypothetical protein GEU90_16575 [Gemmatimonas sp.]|nr:hypothetical protein [Gemmatimonas sp.]
MATAVDGNWTAKAAVAFFAVNIVAIVAAIISGYEMGALTHRFEERQAITFLSSNQLAATAIVAWIIFLLARSLRTTKPSRRQASFWAFSAFGFLYLMLDEAFQFHEGMDTTFFRLFGVETDPMLDGAPTAIYGVLAAALCYYFRREITRYSATLSFFLLGGFFLAVTSFLNLGMATTVQIVVEECAKLLGVVSFLLGHLAALAGVIREAATDHAPGADPVSRQLT